VLYEHVIAPFFMPDKYFGDLIGNANSVIRLVTLALDRPKKCQDVVTVVLYGHHCQSNGDAMRSDQSAGSFR
jgi:hypothetical protein